VFSIIELTDDKNRIEFHNFATANEAKKCKQIGKIANPLQFYKPFELRQSTDDVEGVKTRLHPSN
jgi:hypothetical protein